MRETLGYLITSNDKDEVERAENMFKSHENSSNFSKDGIIPHNHTNISSVSNSNTNIIKDDHFNVDNKL